jgi:hypothetical protein
VIEGRYFTSNKKFRLGDDRQKVLDTYGSPHESVSTGDIEILGWEFIGDQIENNDEDLKGRPLAKDSYGHEIRMFFRNKKLIEVILHNYIP